MSFLGLVVGTVNTGWPRPLAESRTSRNQGVLALEKLSLETSFSKHRVLCQRAIRCTSTWRYCIRIFQSTRKRYCKFPTHALQTRAKHKKDNEQNTKRTTGPADPIRVNRIPVISSIRDPTKSGCGCPTAGRTDHKPTFL